MDDARGALEGVRVLDLAGALGQHCGRLLADLGADVVKVEPSAGSPARLLAPFAGDQPDRERSLYFVNFNTNKRGVALDLDRTDGRALFLDLVRAADVVIEDFPPGTLDRLGLGYAELAAANPRIVLTSITPFGQTGPYRDFKASDMIGVAMGGMMYINGEPHLPPCTSPLDQAYQMTALHAAFGTLLALLERRRSGRGQRLDVSMQEVEAHMFFNFVTYAASADIPQRLGERGAIVPNSIYPTKDGHASLSIFYPHHWRLLAAWLDDPVFQDPGWEEREIRRENQDLVDGRVAELTKQFTTAEFVAAAQRHHLAAAPVNTVADFAALPHVRERRVFVQVDHPVLGRLPVPGPAIRMSATPLRIHRPAPTLGQHTEEVRREWLDSPRPAPCTGAAGDRRLPLEGVRVIDFSRVWAGPFGARFLADYGADVIRVESARFPDTRGAPHLPPGPRRERDAHFAEMHRNKRSVTLDLHLPDGQELARRLIGTADVVIENYGVGVMERFGLGYDRLRDLRPDIVMLSMPGLGREGPDSRMLAYGQQLMGYVGLSPLWRQPESSLAASTKLAFPDFIAAGLVGLAATAALLVREQTGEGQFVELAQIDATAQVMGVAFLDYFVNGRIAEARGNADPNFAPHAAYRCLGHDRWVAIACATEEEWRSLCAVMHHPDLVADPRFATKPLRHANRAALDPLIEAWTSEQTPHQVMYRLQRVGVPAGVVASAEDLYHDLHLRARGYPVTIDHPDAGRLDHPGMTVGLSATPGRVRRAAPRLGEHNAEVFQVMLGLSPAEYDDLVARGVIA
jgi:crotonobetainyl-CoA:carnitine CoA-transferase CaiB-like acyl-CoA transferase